MLIFSCGASNGLAVLILAHLFFRVQHEESLSYIRNTRERLIMIFKGPAGFARLMNIFLNIILGIGIACLLMGIMTKQTGMPILTPFNVFCSLVVSFMVGYFVGDIYPGLIWGGKLAHALHLGKGASYVVMCCVMGAGMGLFIGIGSGWISNINNGIAAVGQFYANFLWIIIVAAMVLATIFIKPCSVLCEKISGCNPLFGAPPEGAPQA